MKTALVTGGTRGIGRAVSLKLARAGYKVLALYGRNREAADELTAQAASEGLKVICIRGDLTRDTSFAEIVEAVKLEAPELHCIVHSAASGVHRDAMDLSIKHLRFTFEINVFSIHNLIVSLNDRLVKGSSIIGVTSAGGTRVIPHYAAIGASKGALESLFRHYAREMAPRGISVNLVCPGIVLTEAIEAFVDKEARIEASLRKTPTGALTTVEQVADMVGFLATSPAGSQIQGQTLVIDGGMTLLT